MIGSVRGTVVDRAMSGEVLVEANGVGYRVYVPLSAVPVLDVGAPAFLFTHTHVREDAIVLYGFPTREERDTFEVLIGSSGVGPKLALAILSVHSPGALRRALVDDDVDALVLVPGVGKRTAQKLLVDLKTRLDVPDVDLADAPAGARSARAEVREALAGLGYGAEEIRTALAALADDGEVEDLLRDALKHLSDGKVRQ